jgi:molybdopterin-guanine dinucleotide biosynthesis protein A
MAGLPKGTLRCDGALPLVARLLIQATSSGVEEIVIVANEPRTYANVLCKIIPDRRINMGPVAGIEAALYHFAERCDAVLILPCDLPEISSNEIAALLSVFENTGAPVIFAETVDGRKHPLCAVISADLRADVSAAIDSGTLCASDLWAQLGGIGVVFNKVDAFTNLNSPTDVDVWRAKKRKLAPSFRVAQPD